MRPRRERVAIELQDSLADFAREHRIEGRGPLSVMLCLTEDASKRRPPYKEVDFLTPKGGQVKGLSGPKVQKILARHGVSRNLASEGGRTSRGSIERMRAYVALLNRLAQGKLLDLRAVESWWVARVKDFLASQPFKLKMDASKSLRQIVRDLMDAAFARQKATQGTMVAGAMLQHLVGAKLALVLPRLKIDHCGFSVADKPRGRKGDFLVGDTAIHVTTAPSKELTEKCRENLDQNLRPLIVTTEGGAAGAEALAKSAGLAERIDVLGIEQFITTNIYELSGFSQSKRTMAVGDLVSRYNDLIDACEEDPSLKISIGR